MSGLLKIQAEDQGDGTFLAEAWGPFEAESIPLVILVETVNINDETDETRKFAFRDAALYGNTPRPWTTFQLTSMNCFISSIIFSLNYPFLRVKYINLPNVFFENDIQVHINALKKVFGI